MLFLRRQMWPCPTIAKYFEVGKRDWEYQYHRLVFVVPNTHLLLGYVGLEYELGLSK